MKKTHIGLMIILSLLAILWFVFLELNQNYRTGWIASLLIFILAAWLMPKLPAGFFIKLGAWLALLAALIVTAVLTPAPLKNYPAADYKDPQ